MNEDFRDLFAALNTAGAEYLLVGGLAVAFHSAPRYTKDADIFFRASLENARRVHSALAAFGAPVANLRPEELSVPDVIFQIGVEPNRIDLITSIEAVSFDEAWPNRAHVEYGGQQVPVIGLDDLIRNKAACAEKHPERPHDAADLKVLKKFSNAR